MESKIVYFDRPGKENTEETLRIAGERATELGVKTVVVASTFGDAAVKAVEILKGLRVVAVTHAASWREPNGQEFTEENRKIVESKGGIILTTTHTFSGLSKAIRDKTHTEQAIGDIIANVLRTFGQGMKVAFEITMMAADSGLVRVDEDIVAVAGTGHGSDTAVVFTPVNSHNFFALKVKEILCKPHF